MLARVRACVISAVWSVADTGALWWCSVKGEECLAEKARYSIKVWHTHMYLTGDTTLLYQFPIIQFCWKKQLLARLCLVDKLESKQDKLMSLQIGSLVR
jgi:hypothetical protein